MKLREFDDLSNDEGTFEDDRIIRDDPFVEIFGNPADYRIDRSRRYKDEELKAMSIEERYLERQKCAKDKNILGMIDFFSYDFKRYGDPNGNRLIALSFLYGRIGDITELLCFVEENRAVMLFVGQETIEIAKFMMKIGFDYPDLNKCQLDYLEMLYTNKKYCSIIDELLFDKEKLPRVIKGITREQLKINKQHQ